MADLYWATPPFCPVRILSNLREHMAWKSTPSQCDARPRLQNSFATCPFSALLADRSVRCDRSSSHSGRYLRCTRRINSTPKRLLARNQPGGSQRPRSICRRGGILPGDSARKLLPSTSPRRITPRARTSALYSSTCFPEPCTRMLAMNQGYYRAGRPRGGCD